MAARPRTAERRVSGIAAEVEEWAVRIRKELAERGLVTHKPYRGVELTRTGRRLAIACYARNRVLLVEIRVDRTVQRPRQSRAVRVL